MTENNIIEQYSECTLCPRKCGADRYKTVGFCKAGVLPKVARASLHVWEEPVLSSAGGSGAVFFSGCTMRCVFCQNHNISEEGFGKEITPARLADIFLELQDKGAQNIDLITASHYLPSVIAALDIAKHRLHIPVVYNCGGYETAETVAKLNGYVDIYLPDIKYFSDELALKYSNAPHYFETALNAVREMISQVGAPQYENSSKTRIMTKGVIIRHMVLPGHRKDSVAILNAVSSEFKKDMFLISLLSQYTPFYRVLTDVSLKSLNRRITSFEYDSVVNEALKLGLDGFMQEKSSAKEEYTPEFNLEGVLS